MAAATDSSGWSLTVMTYNIGNGMANPGRLVAALRDSGADIVGLQELDSKQSAAIASDLVDVYPHQVLFPMGIPGKGLLSRHPIESVRQLDVLPGRPDLEATVDAAGMSLHVFITHPPPPRPGLTGLVYGKAAQPHLEDLARSAASAAPAIVLGDFNMLPTHRNYARIKALGLIDAFATAGSGRGATLPARLGQPSRVRFGLERLPLRALIRIDYIWHTAPLRALEAWVGADAGSDHLPVLARLALPDNDKIPSDQPVDEYQSTESVNTG